MSPPRNWDSPNPSTASECALPLRTKGWGAHSPATKGVGESQFRRLEKMLDTLPTLWVNVYGGGEGIVEGIYAAFVYFTLLGRLQLNKNNPF